LRQTEATYKGREMRSQELLSLRSAEAHFRGVLFVCWVAGLLISSIPLWLKAPVASTQ